MDVTGAARQIDAQVTARPQAVSEVDTHTEQWVLASARLAREAAAQVSGMKARAVTLEPGAQAAAQVAAGADGLMLTIGVPTGRDGQDGTPGQDGLDAPQIDDTQASADSPWSGQKVQEELDALTAADVGARPDTWMPTAQEVGALAATGSGALVQTGRVELSVAADGWTQNAQGWYEKTVACAGAVADSAVQRVDAAVQGEQIGDVLLAGLRVDADDTLTMVCLAKPSEAFTLLVLLSEVV